MMRATVLPRILPQSQVEIDSYRDRFEVEIDALQANCAISCYSFFR